MEDLNDRLRKAAALVASLDESTANSLLSQLTPAEAAAVRAAAESLDKVDRLEQEALARELESRRVAAQVQLSGRRAHSSGGAGRLRLATRSGH